MTPDCQRHKNKYSKSTIAAVLAISSILLSTGLAFSSGQKAEARGGSSNNAKPADDPGCRECYANAAALFAGNEMIEAANLLRSWRLRCPHNAKLQLLLSAILVRLGGHTDEALQAANAAVQAAPGMPAAHLQLGMLYASLENDLSAKREFERVTEIDPGNCEAWSGLSNILSRLHENERAQKCADKAAALEPSSITARLRMFRNLEDAGKLKEARLELKRLLQDENLGPEFQEQLAEAALSLGAWDDALSAATKLSEAYPHAPTPIKLTAIAQLNSRAYESALTTGKRMLALDPNSSEAHALIGRALLKLGAGPEGEKELHQALALQPDLPSALAGEGELEYGRGNYIQASEHLSRAIDADPSLGKLPDLCYMLAKAMDKQGDQEGSLMYYKRSLANGLSGSDAEQAKESIARLGLSTGARSK